jgi:hypothetical protein
MLSIQAGDVSTAHWGGEASLAAPPEGTGGAVAASVHAGAVFRSPKEFRQALKQGQNHHKFREVLHRDHPAYVAYVCRGTHEAIQQAGRASLKGDLGARDRQWWQQVCGRACGFAAQVQQATLKGDRERWRITMLSDVMQAYIQDHPLATAPSEVGRNGVQQSRWVVTLYAPHTCGLAPAAPVAATAAAAAAAAATLPALAVPDAAAAPAAVRAPSAWRAPAGASACPELAFAGTENIMPDDPFSASGTPAALEGTRSAGGNAGGGGGSATDAAFAGAGYACCHPCQDSSEARLAVRPDGTAIAPSVHAGAVFDSPNQFRQAMKQGQKHWKLREVMHQRHFGPASGAYICREMRKAVDKEHFAWGRGDPSTREQRWWRHVCVGACGFVAQVQKAGDRPRTTALSEAMQAHIKDNPLTAAACEVWRQWRAARPVGRHTYVQHTCAGATAARVAAPGTLAARAAAAPDADQGDSKASSAWFAAPKDGPTGCGLVDASGTSGAFAKVRQPFAKRPLQSSLDPRAEWWGPARFVSPPGVWPVLGLWLLLRYRDRQSQGEVSAGRGGARGAGQGRAPGRGPSIKGDLLAYPPVFPAIERKASPLACCGLASARRLL